MNWIFTNDQVLTEANTGFTIHLFAGSWLRPKEIRPQSPQGILFHDQTQLLRSGLEFGRQYRLNEFHHLLATNRCLTDYNYTTPNNH